MIQGDCNSFEAFLLKWPDPHRSKREHWVSFNHCDIYFSSHVLNILIWMEKSVCNSLSTYLPGRIILNLPGSLRFTTVEPNRCSSLVPSLPPSYTTSKSDHSSSNSCNVTQWNDFVITYMYIHRPVTLYYNTVYHLLNFLKFKSFSNRLLFLPLSKRLNFCIFSS